MGHLMSCSGFGSPPNKYNRYDKEKMAPQRTFIDLFAGCGGLSLGLTQAGWKGLFAIERAKDAFSTFAANFLDGPTNIRFQWPSWLEKGPHSIQDVLAEHAEDLKSLAGSIDVIAGGPPCQGYSFAGRRRKADPRNMLFQHYVRFVALVKPKVLILENVPAMQVVHGAQPRNRRRVPGPVPKSYFERLVGELDAIGYCAQGAILEASRFGVPQRRPRLIVIGVRKDVGDHARMTAAEIFQLIEACRCEQLEELGLSEMISASEAISDLETRSPLVPCVDPESKNGFFEPTYQGPSTAYQALMHAGFDLAAMNSVRLANHTNAIIRRFGRILKGYRRGHNLTDKDRERLGLLKHRTVPMAEDRPAPTLTTLPDDMLHYAEPRILSVRESARLQSFPDWFVFRGVFTTGGTRRRRASPRYTQVGNAVPPLLARTIGSAIARALGKAATSLPAPSPRRLLDEREKMAAD